MTLLLLDESCYITTDTQPITVRQKNGAMHHNGITTQTHRIVQGLKAPNPIPIRFKNIIHNKKNFFNDKENICLRTLFNQIFLFIISYLHLNYQSPHQLPQHQSSSHQFSFFALFPHVVQSIQ